MIDAQDKMLQDAMATMDREAAPIERPEARITPTVANTPRRSVIVEEAGEVATYAVTIDRRTFDVEETSRGRAVLRAGAIAKREGMTNVGGHIFLLNYLLTDADGKTFSGRDMHEEVQAARIALQRR